MYYWDKKIEASDPASFEIIDSIYTKDNNYRYAWGEKFVWKIKEDSPYWEEVYFLSQQYIYSNYAERGFDLKEFVDRVQFIEFIVAINYDQSHAEECIQKQSDALFPDVSSEEWFAPYVCVARQEELVQGYQDGLFYPTKNITFAEAAKIISLIKNKEIKPGTSFEWHIPYVEFLKQKNVVPDTNPSPSQQLTWGEAAQMLYRMSQQE